MKPAQLLQKYVEVGIIDVRNVRRAARWLDVLVDLAVSGAFTLECFDERAHGTRRNHFVGVHAAEVWPPQRTRSVFWAEGLGRCGRNEVALSESGEARTVERLELTLVRGVSALQHVDHAGDEVAFLAPGS